MIHQGSVYWLSPIGQPAAKTDIPHPYVVIEYAAPTQESPGVVTICALTTNMKKISVPGNVLLDAGEADLPRASVVEVAKTITIDEAGLGRYVGQLSEERVRQIMAGLRLVKNSYFNR